VNKWYRKKGDGEYIAILEAVFTALRFRLVFFRPLRFARFFSALRLRLRASLRRKEGIALAHLYGRAEARALTLVWMVDAMGTRE
jgi:hypothetical protein